MGGGFQKFSVGLFLGLEVAQRLQSFGVEYGSPPPGLYASACSYFDLALPVFRLQEVHEAVLARIELQIGGHRGNEHGSQHDAGNHGQGTDEPPQMRQGIEVAITRWPSLRSATAGSRNKCVPCWQVPPQYAPNMPV
eukprot:CAMPEP_0179413876 /NCGR_PEP_ID=MMETSP0799-20121207/5344_1 /TAXON_ID=46947 /ORGANISM="Geminigera cryophila, Strain CCMP2564" /LENGTH=136 /DNA_ID=CAMNT_0021186401 /DNA_START=159 /DNA_END=569 /DNA_ORIENTATION=+